MEGNHPENEPNCINCRFFFVTWEPATPNGCKAYGFKSKERPAKAVYLSSGASCQLFEPKQDPPVSPSAS